MRHRHIFLLLTLSFLLFPLTATGVQSEESPYDTAARLQKKYETIKSLSFAFSQRTSSGLGGRPQAGRGQAFFIRSEDGGKMRWNYSLPEQQVLISDGQTFSMYFAHLKQMILSPASAIDSDLTYSFFTGKGSITEDFLIYAPDPEVGSDSLDGSLQVIKIVPKEVQSQVENIHLWVTAEALIQRIEIKDHFGTVTTLNFSNIEVNSLESLAEEEIDELFSFTPPPGTEIIEQ